MQALKRFSTKKLTMLYGAVLWTCLVSACLGLPIEDGEWAAIELQDGEKPNACWFDLDERNLYLFWNPSSKTAVVKFDGDPAVYRYNELSDGVRKRIDNIIRWSGNGETTECAKKHGYLRPLQVEYQVFVGVDGDGRHKEILVSFTTPTGWKMLDDTWRKCCENYRVNEQARAIYRAEQRARDALRAAERAEQAARRAEQAARDSRWRAITTMDTLRGLGLLD